MAILDLQRRLTEAGRIRIGATEETNGRKRPKKLETFRLTSRDKTRIDAIASLYGGTTEAWDDRQWQVFTDAAELPIMLIPGQELSAWWELWGSPASGGAVSCLRRCDGEREILSEGPCLCPPHDERRELATKGRACRPTTRLSVLLPEVKGVGSWRLESHGYYAAVELAGAAHILQRATAAGVLLPARLRLDQREARRGGQVRKFAVPTIEVDGITPTSLLELAGGVTTATPAIETPSPVAALPRPQADEPLIDAKDRRQLFAAARSAGLDEPALRALVEARTGSSSTSSIAKSEFAGLLAEIKEAKQ